VWLVEDNPLEATQAQGLLSGAYTVERFSDVAPVLERLSRGGAVPHLLLLDWQLLGGTGQEACRLLRERYDEVTLPILVLLAGAERDDRRAALAAGANDSVTRPYVEEELLARVRTLVRMRTQAEEARAQLEAERERLQSLFENVPAAVCTLRGANHVFESVNPLYQRLLGGRRDLVGLPVAEAMPEVVAQGFIRLLDDVYRGGEPYVGHDMPIRLRRRGDSALEDVFFTFIYQPRQDAAGRTQGIDVFAFEVTQHVRARQEAEALSARLREGEERYRTLFESIDDGFCIMQMLLDASGETVDYRFLETNATFERHTGLKNAVGRTARELVPDLDASWFERYGRVAATGETLRFESPAPAMGRWFEVFASRVGAPALRQVALVFKDITERKAAEEERTALLAREQAARAEAEAERQKLHALFQQAPVAISIHEGPRHTYTFANSAHRTLMGDREVVGKALLEALPELKGQGFDTQFDQVVATGLPVYGKERPVVLTRAGRPETAWFNFVFSPKRSASGQVDGVMQCAFEVTEQVRARWKEEALAERLRLSEEHLRRVVDVTRVGVWEVELSTQQVVADARFHELFGLAPGAPFSVKDSLALTHPEDSPRVTQAISDVLSGKDGGHYHVEYRTRRFPDGRVQWVEARGQVSFGPDGKPVRFLGTGLDITARKTAELAQQALLEALSAQPLVGVALYRGPRLVIEWANPLFRRVIGNGRDIVGKPLLEAVPEIGNQGFLDIITRVRRTGQPFIGREARASFERGAGEPPEEFFFDFVYHPVQGADGHDAILVLFQDVTHAVRARVSSSSSSSASTTCAPS
jgi:PAS domain S-box-containing protein